ncbi:MAG TPA: P-II family nitrogen regulator, partial [Fimbriimonas sp.]|nr:P-II family nitrogen regulator [Fimbriimonas sp.]
NLAPRIKLEVVVPAEILDEARSAILSGAETGEVGDGIIFVTQLTEVLRVRTGESGSVALE